MTTTLKTLHLSIRGRVQGVGYRASLQQVAQAHGLRGWVRNRADGQVEALLHGPADAVDAALAWAQRGPPLARVVAVETTALTTAPSDLPPDFAWRPTA